MDVHPPKNGINRYWPIPILVIHYLPTEGYANATLPGKNLENSDEWFSPTGHLSRPSMFGQMDRWREKNRTTRGPVYQPFFQLNTPFSGQLLSGRLSLLDISFSWHPFLMSPLSLDPVFPWQSWHPLHWQLWILTSHSPDLFIEVPFSWCFFSWKVWMFIISLSWHFFLLTSLSIDMSLLRWWMTAESTHWRCRWSRQSTVLFWSWLLPLSLHFSTFITSLFSSCLYILHFST